VFQKDGISPSHLFYCMFLPMLAVLAYSLHSLSGEGRRRHLERNVTARERVHDKDFLARTQAGDLARFDVAAMARELRLALQARVASSNEQPRVLFDWSEVTSWPYKPSSQKDIAFWRETVPMIYRAAIVHSRRWDSQAALLAVLLRLANAEVRSFSPLRFDDAISWLTSDKEAVAKDYGEATLTDLRRGPNVQSH
jgi:hypothetical protein